MNPSLTFYQFKHCSKILFVIVLFCFQQTRIMDSSIPYIEILPETNDDQTHHSTSSQGTGGVKTIINVIFKRCL